MKNYCMNKKAKCIICNIELSVDDINDMTFYCSECFNDCVCDILTEVYNDPDYDIFNDS